MRSSCRVSSSTSLGSCSPKTTTASQLNPTRRGVSSRCCTLAPNAAPGTQREHPSGHPDETGPRGNRARDRRPAQTPCACPRPRVPNPRRVITAAAAEGRRRPSLVSLAAVAARATRHAGHNTTRTTTTSIRRRRSEREPVEAKPRLGLHVAGHADRREGRKEECGDHRDGRGEQPDGRGAENSAARGHRDASRAPRQGRIATRLDPGLSGEHRAEHGDQREPASTASSVSRRPAGESCARARHSGRTRGTRRTHGSVALRSRRAGHPRCGRRLRGARRRRAGSAPRRADRLEERTADVEVGQIRTGWGYELAGSDFDAHHPQPASQRILAGGQRGWRATGHRR